MTLPNVLFEGRIQSGARERHKTPEHFISNTRCFATLWKQGKKILCLSDSYRSCDKIVIFKKFYLIKGPHCECKIITSFFPAVSSMSPHQSLQLSTTHLLYLHSQVRKWKHGKYACYNIRIYCFLTCMSFILTWRGELQSIYSNIIIGNAVKWQIA